VAIYQVQAADERWPNSNYRNQVITSASLQAERNSVIVADSQRRSISRRFPGRRLSPTIMPANGKFGTSMLSTASIPH
jgi:hypothetical protein